MQVARPFAGHRVKFFDILEEVIEKKRRQQIETLFGLGGSASKVQTNDK